MKSDEKVKPIVICCDDPLQSVMDCNYDDFKDEYLLSNCNGKQGEITRLMDKDVQMDIAKKCGVRIPKSWKIPRYGSIPDDIIFPCIVKPDISITGLKSQITICNNVMDLKTAVSKRSYLVQEFIRKDFEIGIWGTSVGANEYYMPVVNRKIRMYPNDYTLSSYCVVEDFKKHPGLDKEALIKFMQALKYSGMFSIDMIVRDNVYYLLEVNLRNGGKQYFSTAAGANLPWIYINSLVNKHQEAELKVPVYCMGETTDFKQIFRKKVSPVRWLRDLSRTKCFFIFNWRDPKPFVYQLSGKLLSHFHK